MDIGMIHIDDRPQGLGKPVLFTYNLMGVFYDTAALRGRYQMTVITEKNLETKGGFVFCKKLAQSRL